MKTPSKIFRSSSAIRCWSRCSTSAFPRRPPRSPDCSADPTKPLGPFPDKHLAFGTSRSAAVRTVCSAPSRSPPPASAGQFDAKLLLSLSQKSASHHCSSKRNQRTVTVPLLPCRSLWVPCSIVAHQPCYETETNAQNELSCNRSSLGSRIRNSCSRYPCHRT